MLKGKKYFNRNLFIADPSKKTIFKKFAPDLRFLNFLKNKVKVSVAIINTNNVKDTIECVPNILNTQRVPVLILVLNNGSEERIDDFKNYLEKEGAKVLSKKIDFGFLKVDFSLWQFGNKFLLLADADKNIGFCGGNNFLVSLSHLVGLDYCLILNDDARLTENILADMLRIIRKEKISALSPQIFDKEGNIWYAGGDFSWYSYGYIKKPKSSLPYLTKLHSGCAVLVRIKDYIEIDGMEEILFVSLDEADLARRILKKGEIMVAPRLKVIHKIGGTLGTRGSSFHDYVWTRNRLIYSLKNNFILVHWFFVFIYSLMKSVKWVMWLVGGGKERAENEIQAFWDYFRRDWWAGCLKTKINALDFKKVLYG